MDSFMFWCLLGVTAFIALMHGREMYSRGRMDGIKATMGIVEAVVRAAKSGDAMADRIRKAWRVTIKGYDASENAMNSKSEVSL